VRRLAGGVAQEFNNLLTVIAGHAELMLDHLPADHPARVSAMEIRRAARSGGALTHQLLAMSGSQVLAPAKFDLNDAAWELAERASAILPANIGVRVDLAGDAALVDADREQLQRGLMNLIANARDAMPHGGQIVISTRRAQTFAGPTAELAVSDTGRGMNEEAQTRLFEPFYSTKPAGACAGLGLATTRGIVEQTGGTIGVDSAPGRGTTVTITLPAREEKRTEPAPLGARLRPSSAIRLPVAAFS